MFYLQSADAPLGWKGNVEDSASAPALVFRQERGLIGRDSDFTLVIKPRFYSAAHCFGLRTGLSSNIFGAIALEPAIQPPHR